MKTLLTILMLFTLTVNAQSYECTDQVRKSFNIVITDNAYNLVVDSFLFVTELDTILKDSICTKYIPKNIYADTLVIYNTLASFMNNKEKTTFVIIRELEPWEEQVLFNKKLYYIKI